MQLYFSCSLTGGRQDQPVYAALVNYLQAQGHTVLTAHLAAPAVMAAELAVDPCTVYTRDIAWLDAAAAVIAEVSTPSHGVGYEIAYALLAGKPVLCLFREGARVSKMLSGNSEARLRVKAYASEAEAVEAVRAFLESI